MQPLHSRYGIPPKPASFGINASSDNQLGIGKGRFLPSFQKILNAFSKTHISYKQHTKLALGRSEGRRRESRGVDTVGDKHNPRGRNPVLEKAIPNIFRR